MSFDALASGWSRILGIDRKQFNMFFERMMDGFAYHKIVLDKAGKPVDYVFLEVNSAFEKLTGLKRESVIGKKATEVLPGIEKDPADWIGVFGRVAITCEPVQFENYAKPLDRWYNVSAYCPQKGYFVALFEDITDRKKTLELLKESEQKWATTLSSIGDAVITTDLSGNVTFLNGVAEGLTGWSSADASGKALSEVFNIVNEKTRGKVESPVVRVLQEGLVVGLANHTVLIKKDGTEVPIDDSGAPIRDREDKVTGVVLVFRDIRERKKAEKQIAEQALMLANANDAIIGYGLDQKVTFWNKAAEKLYGYTSEEVLGKSGFDLLKPVYVNARRQELLDKIQVQGHNESESFKQTKDGRGVCVEAHVILLRDEAGKPIGYVSVDRDITERKKAERELWQAKNDWERTFDSDPDLIAIIDNNHRIVRANKAMAQTLGVTPEQAVGLECFTCVHGTTAPPEFCPSTKTLQDGKEHTAEVHEPRLGGDFLVSTTPLMDEKGCMVGSIHVARNITERKKAENALRESEARLERSQEIAHLGSWELDLRENKLTWSDEVYRIFGLKPQEFGATYEAFLASVHPEDRAAVDAAFSGSLREGKDGYEIEHRVIRRDNGEIRFVHEKCTHFRDESGKITKSLGMVHDITEQKNAEEALRYQSFLVDSALDAIYSTDSSFNFVSWNKAAGKMFGWRAEEVLGKSSREVLRPVYPTSEGATREQILKELAENGSWTGEIVYQRKDGSTIPVISAVSSLKDYTGKQMGIISVAHDITRRKSNEEALKKQADLINLSPDGIIIRKLDGTIKFWSHGAENMYGWKKEEAIGQSTNILLRTEFTIPLKEIIKQIELNGQWIGELTHATKGGQKIVVQSYWLGRFNSNNELVELLESNVDITERKQMVEKLEEYAKNLEELVEERTKEVTEERQRLYNVLETIPAYVVLLDKDYHVPFANKVFRDLFGESNGRCCYDYLFHRDSPCEMCETYKVLKTGKPHRWEWTGPNGRNYDIYDFPFKEADGSTLILEMGIDITQRKKAEAEVKASSLYTRSLIEASLDPLVTINAEGKITDVNEATIQATGCSRDDLIGSDFCDYFTQPEQARKGYQKVFTDGYVTDYPLTLINKTGKTMDILYNASVYKNEKGEVQGVFAAARDITERNRAEAELKKYQENLENLVAERTKELRLSEQLARLRAKQLEATQLKLEQKATEVEEYATRMEELAEQRALKLKDAERLAAIGATAGMVGHDIRNPLQSILGDLYLAKSDVTPLPSSQRKTDILESLEAIQKSVDYVNKIVQDLQDYAKPLKPIIHETDLQSIITDILKKNDIPKNIKIYQRIAENAQTLKVDPDFLKRILGNLVNNGIQAMPEGGKLTIKATKKNGNVILTVKDTGTGIPEAAKANLFTPLFTTKSKGQGFGLAVVKRMTEAMGGTVTFESEGKGAEFSVTLPQ